MCTQIFPTDFIEAHASACGERYPFTCLSFFSHQQLSYSLCKCDTKYLYVASASAGNEMHASTISEEEAAIPGTSGGDRDRDGGEDA